MQFYLAGESPSASREVDVDANGSLYDLKDLIAARFAIVEPSGVTFGNDQGALSTLQEVVASNGPVSISIDGRTVRDAPGPKGLPFIGNHFDVFPDHLGNHQRLFEHYGPVIKTESLGRTTYLTNDPVIAGIAFAESDFFTKAINKAHPLYPIKNKAAGVFLGDTDTEEWRVAHKFLPPALGPKAVRHYAPTMQKTVEDAFSVFDELDGKNQAWNVYQYMLKLGSQAVGKLVLGMDFNHFTSPNAYPAEMVRVIAESLELNKKIASKGDWYSKLPFWEPKRLQVLTDRMYELVNEVIAKAESSGVHDLPLQDAALEASNMIDYAIRATDSKGDKLPKTSLVEALVVATGAGFTTTSSLLSWLIYGLVTYPGMQERLLQELIDNGIDENTQFTADVTDKLDFLDKYIKETQRRHNPSFQPGRTAKTDLVLPGGYKIPKDAIVIPAIHHIHNNPNLWDNPNSFDPDRWDSEQVKNRPKNSYIPFATGQRMCIGFNFALQEVKIFLPKLVYRYKFMPEEVGTTEYDPMFQLIRPVNLYVRAEKRVKWPPRSDA